MVFILIGRRLDCDTPNLVRQAQNGRRGSISCNTDPGADKVQSCSHQSFMTSSSSQAQRTCPRYVACEGAKKPPRSASAKNSALLDQNACPQAKAQTPRSKCELQSSEFRAINTHQLQAHHLILAKCEMPRLSPNLLHRLRKQDPLLPLLLQATRDPASAKNELRWLREFVDEQRQKINSSSIGLQTSNYKDMKWQRRLRKLCKDRARGKPLQYILGTEYFGDLEIACAKDVLIPR